MKMQLALQSLPTQRFLSFLLIVMASLLIGLCGSLAIPLPFTPVPLALRSLVILGLSCFLGGRGAFFAVLGFLVQAAVGLPILAGGAVTLLGPTGGYCLGYLVAAYTVGSLVEKRKNQTSLRLFAILYLGTAIIWLFGAVHLAFFVGVPKAFWLGIVPFILGDSYKVFALVAILRQMGRVQR